MGVISYRQEKYLNELQKETRTDHKWPSAHGVKEEGAAGRKIRRNERKRGRIGCTNPEET